MVETIDKQHKKLVMAMTPKPLLRNFLPSEKRTLEQVWEHYSVERELADRLRQSAPGQRQSLYSEVYEELYRRVPHHSQLTRVVDANSKKEHLGWQVSLLRRFLNKNQVFLEIGGGDCALSMEIAPLVAKAVGCDVAPSLSAGTEKPDNFKFLRTDGRSFDLEDASVDIAYSNQLMEHLHVDDARAQLVDIFRVLRSGGRYVCVTPNRFGGPWDISMYFDLTATGFYTSAIGVKDLDYQGNQPNRWDGVPNEVLDQYGLSYSEKDLKDCVRHDDPTG